MPDFVTDSETACSLLRSKAAGLVRASVELNRTPAVSSIRYRPLVDRYRPNSLKTIVGLYHIRGTMVPMRQQMIEALELCGFPFARIRATCQPSMT